jgi:fructose-1,6-bisphosphatase/inositol monophosphatase family enzyme
MTTYRDCSNATAGQPERGAGVLIAREAGARVLDHDGYEHSQQSSSAIAVTPALEAGSWRQYGRR